MATVPNTETILTPKAVDAFGQTRPTSLVGWVRWLSQELHWTFRVVVSSADRFYWDNGFSKAASLAYTTLFALVPLTVLAFALLSSFALSNEHLPQVRDFMIRQFVPQLDVVNEIIEYLNHFSETLASLNMLAVVFIVVTAILLINSIEFALNEIWQVYEPRPWSQRIGIYCAVLVLAPVLALSTYYFARFRLEGILVGIGIERYDTLVAANLVPFLIDFVAFASLYFLVPKAPVRLRSAVFGAVLAALLFGVAKWGFALYIVRFSSYNSVYGALASIPVFLFWLYLAWSIVLVGAEVSYQAQYLPRNARLWKRTVMSIGDGRLLLAVQALVMIASAFRKGERLPNDLDLAEKLGCSSVLLKPTLDSLQGAGLVQRGDSRAMPLVLLKDPDMITLEQIQAAVFAGRQSMFCPAEMAKAFGAFHANLQESVTLSDLIVADLVVAQGVVAQGKKD